MDNNSLALAITKAIGMNENGGHVDLNKLQQGKSGEMKSIFQFEPSTWALYSKQVAGKKLPLNPDNETKVVAEKVYKWLEAGDSPEQIMSMWNAGEGEKDAYTGKFSDGKSSIGMNQYGVKYNVPAYVNNGMNYLKQVQPQLSAQVASGGQAAPTNTPPVPQGQQAPVIMQGGQPQAHQPVNPLEGILTKIQSMVNPQSTPVAVGKPLSPPKAGKPGLIAGMLPQYAQK